MRSSAIKLPLIITVASLVAMLVLVLVTSPVKDVLFAIIFFGLLYVLLSCLIIILVIIRNGVLSSETRLRVLIISGLLTLLAMLHSVQSLSPLDMLVLGLIASGVLFYINRRRA